MHLPRPRGPISAALVETLPGAPQDLPRGLHGHIGTGDDVITDEDLQLSLHICYELHYRGFDEVDDRWEWQPSLLTLRNAVEEQFEAALRAMVPVQEGTDVVAGLHGLIAADDGPSLSKFLTGRADVGQFREFVMHRSIYHLREADPHTWAIPRLGGRAKAALVEIQADEYGGGRTERMHSELFRVTMRKLGLDASYGAYLDSVPAITLATNNLMSLFGLHRRLRGAILGHLAVYEMTSSLPNRRYGNGLRRLGYDADATRFYDEHVEADAVHEQIAAHDMCGTFCAEHPALTPDVLFGAASALALDTRFAEHVLGRWRDGQSSLQASSSGRLLAGALGA